MTTAAEHFKPSPTEDLSRASVQPEVQKYLEAVFAVAPFPEEYVRYRLHLATALPLGFIDSWFEKRRQSHQEQAAEGSKPSSDANGVQATPLEADRIGLGHDATRFSLFGASDQQEAAGQQKEAANSLQRSTDEVATVGHALTMMQASHLPPAGTEEQNPSAGQMSGRSQRSSREVDAAPPSSRFSEVDLDSISSLVGLETITSTEEHCGSRSLYMFEQLTALDSLDLENGGASKRRRTRHQHFWRNTDKLDPDDRVYVPTASIKPALKRQERVMPKRDISPEDRTNAWTVCLTTRGVVGYLNKRISPLGVRLIRALQSGRTGSAPGVNDSTAWDSSRGDLDPGFQGLPGNEAVLAPRPKRMRSVRTAGDVAWETREDPPYQPHTSTRSTSNGSEEDDDNDGSRELSVSVKLQPSDGQAGGMVTGTVASGLGEEFEPIPRARKRKPS